MPASALCHAPTASETAFSRSFGLAEDQLIRTARPRRELITNKPPGSVCVGCQQLARVASGAQDADVISICAILFCERLDAIPQSSHIVAEVERSAKHANDVRKRQSKFGYLPSSKLSGLACLPVFLWIAAESAKAGCASDPRSKTCKMCFDRASGPSMLLIRS